MSYKNQFLNLVKDHQNLLWIPERIDNTKRNYFVENKNKQNNSIIYKEEIPRAKKLNKAKEYRLITTPFQETILRLMLNATTRMYNETRDFLKIYASQKLKYDVLFSSEYKKLKKNDPSFSKEKLELYESSCKIFHNIMIRLEDWERVRTKFLFEQKDKILRFSHLTESEYKELVRMNRNERIEKFKTYEEREDYQVFPHTLDAAIKFAIANYNSAKSNIENGTMKKTSLRHLSFQRRNWVMEIENGAYLKKFKKIMGTIILERNEKGKLKQYFEDELNGTITVKYDKMKDKFFIYASKKENSKTINKEKDFIVIDPGVRSPLNCMTEDTAFKIGTNVTNKIYSRINFTHKLYETDIIQHKLSKLDLRMNHTHYLDNKNVSNKIKKKWRHRFKYKNENLIKNFHWESANKLAKNSRNIIIEDMNVNSIISSKNKTISKTTKNVLKKLSFRTFLEKLKFKCKEYNTNLFLIKAHYTSKTCSECAFYDNELGGSDMFVCKNRKCNLVMDRDFNSCRNIFFKAHFKEYTKQC